jgi:hypothetical protein
MKAGGLLGSVPSVEMGEVRLPSRAFAGLVVPSVSVAARVRFQHLAAAAMRLGDRLRPP